jgi:hypothetical protein
MCCKPGQKVTIYKKIRLQPMTSATPSATKTVVKIGSPAAAAVRPQPK